MITAYIIGYLLYICIGYFATRKCIDVLQEPMPMILFLMAISMLWPILVVFTWPPVGHDCMVKPRSWDDE